VSRLVEFVFSAGGILFLAGTCAIWIALRHRSRRPVTVLAIGVAGYLAVSTPVVPGAIDTVLSRGFRPFEPHDVPAGRVAIVVLGSGGATVVDWSGNRLAPVDVDAAARVLEAARVFRFMPSALVISSGGNSDPGDLKTPTGESMAAALAALGIPAAQLIVEVESRNTREEAVVIAPLVRDRQIERVVLVTSGVHMRRALGSFGAVGIEAIPAVARGWQQDMPRLERWLPGEHGLWYSGRVAHELLGLAYYRARGWLEPRGRI
jgi:uncharacterized SAM-binding protein YcdF (DUF218 family)